MNPASPDFEQRWAKRVEQARADHVPPVNVDALLAAVRSAPIRQRTWAFEFSLVAGSRRLIAACLLGAVTFTGLTSWELWDLWQTVPWAQMVGDATGGVP